MRRSFKLLKLLFEETEMFINNEKLKANIISHLDAGDLVSLNTLSLEKMIDIDSIILETVSTYYKLDDIKKKTRKREYVTARYIFFYMEKRFNAIHFTLTRVGAILNLDHATVLHGVKTIKNLKETNRFINEEVNDIENRIHKTLINETQKLKVEDYEEIKN